MSNRGIGRGLSPSLGLLSVAINVFIGIGQVESSKLDSGAVNLTVARHAHGFLLVKHTSLMVMMMARSTGGSFSGGLGGSGGKTAGIRSRGNMLLLSSRERCSSNTGRVLSRVPRVSGGACCGTSWRWFGIVNNLFKICFGELVLGGG
jgi:hypothetical protein